MIIAAVILIGTAGVLIFSGVFSPKIDTDHKGVVGVISDDWDTGLKEESSETKPGTQIPGYSTAEMKEGDTTLTLSIGNPKANSVGFFGRSFQQATCVFGERPGGNGTGHGPLTACMPCQGVFWKFPKSSGAAVRVAMFMTRSRRNGLMRMAFLIALFVVERKAAFVG